MKTLEMRILTDSIVIHCYRTNKDKEYSNILYEDLNKCIKYWEDKYEDTDYVANDKFSEHFWNIMGQHFTEGCITAILDRYSNGLTYQEIADKNGYSKSCAEQKVKQTLEKIPKPKIWRVLLFEDIVIPRRGTVPGKIVPGDTIYGSNLPSRAITSLTRFMNNQSQLFNIELSPTPENIAKYLTDLKMLSGCGQRTRHDIINYFNSIGYTDTTKHWEDLISQELEEAALKSRKARAKALGKL